MGSGEIILHRLLRHINTGKIQPLSAQSRNRYAAGTEDNNPNVNIRGEGRFHPQMLQFISVCFKVHRCSDWVFLPVSKQSKTLHFPSCTWRQMSDGDGQGRTTRWAIRLGLYLHFTHTCEFTSGNEITVTQQRDADSEGLLDCVQRLACVCYGHRPSCQSTIWVCHQSGANLNGHYVKLQHDINQVSEKHHFGAVGSAGRWMRIKENCLFFSSLSLFVC